MKKINKLLVAIDLSIYSQSVLEYAVAVADRTKAEIVIVNVLNNRDIEAVKKAFEAERPEEFSVVKYQQSELDRRKLKLNNLIKECAPEEMSMEIRFREGIPFKEILKAVNEEKADFLLMGHKGRTNLPGFLFGSAAEKLFRHCPVPVLSLREHTR